MDKDLNLQNLLIRKVTEVLRQGVELLRGIDDDIYMATEKSKFSNGGAIGGHFRHCIEFVNCFLKGVESGCIDYDKRARNNRVETEREYAIAEYARTIRVLESLSSLQSRNPMFVRPEDLNENEDLWCSSSMERELEFLQSHTIHHYALIAFKLRALDVEVPAEFGIAPSTLRFWKSEKAAIG